MSDPRSQYEVLDLVPQICGLMIGTDVRLVVSLYIDPRVRVAYVGILHAYGLQAQALRDAGILF